MTSFFGELRRRNDCKVAVVYVSTLTLASYAAMPNEYMADQQSISRGGAFRATLESAVLNARFPHSALAAAAGNT